MHLRHRVAACAALLTAAWTLAGPAAANPPEDALRKAAERLRQQVEKAAAPPPAPGTTSPSAAPMPTSPPADDEQRDAAPRATERVVAVPLRTRQDLTLSPKFSSAPQMPEVTLSNPYLDPARTVLSLPTSLQCTADGGLLVGGEGGIDAGQRPISSGYWRVAADGAVTPLHTRARTYAGRTAICDVAYGRTLMLPTRPGLAADGSLVVPRGGALLRIGGDGTVRRLAGAPASCTGGGAGTEGLADGAADEARFKDVGAIAAGAGDELWVVDQRGCALRRVDREGHTRTVLGPAQLCAAGGAPENQVTLQRLAWDAQRGELVGAGSILTRSELHTTVWRLRPDGQARRVLHARKLGASPAGAQLDGIDALAIDPQGRVHIGSRRMGEGRRGNDQLAVLRIDEVRGTVVPVTGAALVAGQVFDGSPLDGPAERARFVRMRDMCFAPDGTLYVLDDRTVRRLDRSGQMTTWGF